MAATTGPLKTRLLMQIGDEPPIELGTIDVPVRFVNRGHGALAEVDRAAYRRSMQRALRTAARRFPRA